MGRGARAGIVVLAAVVTGALTACGGGSPSPALEARGGSGSGSSSGASSSSSTASPREGAMEKPEPFRPTAGPGDVVCAYVRPERSSRLDAALPRGASGLAPRARVLFAAPLAVALQPRFVLAAGNRIVVVGRTSYATFDDRGRPIASGDLEGSPIDARIDRGGGAVAVAADERVSKLGAAHRAAAHGELLAVASPGSLRVIDRGGEVRAILDGAFEPLAIGIDDEGTAHAIVRSEGELALWSAPTAYGGSVGRRRLGRYRKEQNETPPILGRTMHVVVLDDRIVALAPDGKKLWERSGALTGGAVVTSDDRLLTASDAQVVAIDPNGRAVRLVEEPGIVFVTAPILHPSAARAAAGQARRDAALLVASGSALHAYAFE